MVGDVVSGEVAYISNRGGQTPAQLQPGAYGISNGRLDAKWPKVPRRPAMPIHKRRTMPRLHFMSTHAHAALTPSLCRCNAGCGCWSQLCKRPT